MRICFSFLLFFRSCTSWLGKKKKSLLENPFCFRSFWQASYSSPCRPLCWPNMSTLLSHWQHYINTWMFLGRVYLSGYVCAVKVSSRFETNCTLLIMNVTTSTGCTVFTEMPHVCVCTHIWPIFVILCCISTVSVTQLNSVSTVRQFGCGLHSNEIRSALNHRILSLKINSEWDDSWLFITQPSCKDGWWVK